MTTIVLLDHLGVAVFAISGAIAAESRRMDVFGAVVLATITAVGGGTLRDLVIGNTPVFWVEEPSYIVVASGAALLTFIIYHWRTLNPSTLAIADAFGLGLFTVLGTNLASDLDFSPIIAVVMGVMTGVFGGIARDVLANDIPLILREEIYATAALAGAVLFIVLEDMGLSDEPALIIAGSFTVLVRLVAFHYKLTLPLFPNR